MINYVEKESSYENALISLLNPTWDFKEIRNIELYSQTLLTTLVVKSTYQWEVVIPQADSVRLNLRAYLSCVLGNIDSRVSKVPMGWHL